MNRKNTNARVGVLRLHGQFQLVATEPAPIAAGELLFRIEGEQTSHPTRYSLQIEERVHIDLGEQAPETLLDRYYWRFMNHHCEPSACIRGRDVYAARVIQPWEEITFNYNTTEYEMAEAFTCQCESAHCRGDVQGFKQLTTPEREVLRPWLAPHLLRLLPAEQETE
nr:SET domain-containing protein-lysine N-methyltransferase [Armatimonas sp.]